MATTFRMVRPLDDAEYQRWIADRLCPECHDAGFGRVKLVHAPESYYEHGGWLCPECNEFYDPDPQEWFYAPEHGPTVSDADPGL